MNIHDIAAIIALGCAIYLIIIGASDIIATKAAKIIADRFDKEHHVPRN